jgi:hypothetical protein
MVPFICQVTENRGLHCSNCSATIGPGHLSPLSAPALGVRLDLYLPHIYFVCIIVPGSWIVIHAEILKCSRFWNFGFGIASSSSSKTFRFRSQGLERHGIWPSVHLLVTIIFRSSVTEKERNQDRYSASSLGCTLRETHPN